MNEKRAGRAPQRRVGRRAAMAAEADSMQQQLEAFMTQEEKLRRGRRSVSDGRIQKRLDEFVDHLHPDPPEAKPRIHYVRNTDASVRTGKWVAQCRNWLIPRFRRHAGKAAIVAGMLTAGVLVLLIQPHRNVEFVAHGPAVQSPAQESDQMGGRSDVSKTPEAGEPGAVEQAVGKAAAVEGVPAGQPAVAPTTTVAATANPAQKADRQSAPQSPAATQAASQPTFGYEVHPSPPKKIAITVYIGNVRSEPRTGAPVLYRLERGTEVIRIGSWKDWCRIRLWNDTQAWAHRSLFE